MRLVGNPHGGWPVYSNADPPKGTKPHRGDLTRLQSSGLKTYFSSCSISYVVDAPSWRTRRKNFVIRKSAGVEAEIGEARGEEFVSAEMGISAERAVSRLGV